MGEVILSHAPARPHDARRWLAWLAWLACRATSTTTLPTRAAISFSTTPHASSSSFTAALAGLHHAVPYVNLQASLDSKSTRGRRGGCCGGSLGSPLIAGLALKLLRLCMAPRKSHSPRCDVEQGSSACRAYLWSDWHRVSDETNPDPWTATSIFDAS